MTQLAAGVSLPRRPWPAYWSVYVALVIAAVAYCLPLFHNLDYYGRGDWDQFTFRYETPRVALLRDLQLPLWNPYTNGGTVLLAHPDSPFPSPWYGLVLALGAPFGLRVQVVLFMILGATGMAGLLRHWKVPDPGCFVGGVVFMMSAHFALQIAEGHLEWCVLGLMPWVVLCLLRAAAHLRLILVASLLLASVLTFGSVYIMAVYVPFLTIWAVLESVRRRSWRFALAWAGTLVLTLLLSAVKLLPQLEFVEANPRPIPAVGLSPAGLGFVFLDPRQALLYRATQEAEYQGRMEYRGIFNEVTTTMPASVSSAILRQLGSFGVDHQWHEYGGYLTWMGFALAVWGFAVSWRSFWPLWTAGALALIVVLGDGSSIDLFALLRRLPLYESLHVPSRFLAAVVFVLAVAAGHGMGWLCRLPALRARRSAVVLITYAIPAVIYLELAVLGWTLFGSVFDLRPVTLPYYQQFATRYREVTTYFPMMNSYLYPVLLSNSAVLSGYENIQVPQGRVRTFDDPSYRGEAYLENREHTARVVRWTMSRVAIDIHVRGSDVLVLNQNHFRGWRASIESQSGIRDEEATATADGLVSVAVRPGDRHVEFYYRPASVLLGGGISAIAIIGCVLLWTLTARRINQHGPEGPSPASRTASLIAH